MSRFDESHSRKVSFIVASDSLSERALSEKIGLEADVGQSGTVRYPMQATWELRESGSGDIDLSDLVEKILTRVESAKRAIAELCRDPETSCLLQVVQYVGDETVGPGFAIEARYVRLLGELGATIDVDQYWVARSEGA